MLHCHTIIRPFCSIPSCILCKKRPFNDLHLVRKLIFCTFIISGPDGKLNSAPSTLSPRRRPVSSTKSSPTPTSMGENESLYVVGSPSVATSCPPVTSRKLQWDWTPVGELAIQPCPIGATGLAKWNCVDKEGRTTGADIQPHWEGLQPDMSDLPSGMNSRHKHS